MRSPPAQSPPPESGRSPPGATSLPEGATARPGRGRPGPAIVDPNADHGDAAACGRPAGGFAQLGSRSWLHDWPAPVRVPRLARPARGGRSPGCRSCVPSRPSAGCRRACRAEYALTHELMAGLAGHSCWSEPRSSGGELSMVRRRSILMRHRAHYTLPNRLHILQRKSSSVITSISCPWF